MNQYEISIKTLNGDARYWLEKLRQILLIEGKGKGTVKKYLIRVSAKCLSCYFCTL